MIKAIAASLLLMIVAVAACTARAQGDPPQTSSRADLQKFDASLAFLRARNARDYAAASPNGIDEARFVEIGGIQQWITIRGDDRNNPGAARALAVIFALVLRKRWAASRVARHREHHWS